MTQTDTDARWRGYGARTDEMPLGGYAALVGLFTAALGAFLITRSGTKLPKRVPLRDALLLGAGTHKLSRIVTKDFVTSPMRAPFVEFRGTSLPGEVSEKSRGRQLRRAVGDLLTCEFCIAPWIAASLLASYSVRPRTGRFIASLFAVVAVSDFLNHAYVMVAKSGREKREQS